MESVATSCVICFDSYDDDAKKPLLLPCHHSFCQQCLQAMEDARDKKCPVCKKGWQHLSVVDAPILYQLIPSGTSADQTGARVKSCASHVEVITFWCLSCKTQICNTCLEKKHKKCNFVAIKKYREREKNYEQLENGLLENLTLYSERLQVIDDFGKELRGQREHCLKRKKASVKMYELLKAVGTVVQVDDANRRLEELRGKKQQVYERLNREVPTDTLFFHVTSAYQKTDEKNTEIFIQNLRRSVGEDPGQGAACSSTIESHTEVTTVTNFQNGEVWMVCDSTACHKVLRVLQNTTARPSHLTLTGVNWGKEELTELLVQVSKLRCGLRADFLDIFWSPGTEGEEDTLSRLQKILIPGHRCTLIQCWGYFNEEGIRKLPDTIQSVGLVLTESANGKALKALLEQAFIWSIFGPVRKKWPNLRRIHLSFAKSFHDPNGALDKVWNADARKLITACCTLNIQLGLHFPRLKSADLVWMRNVILKVTENFSQSQRVTQIFLPGTSLAADDFLDLLKDCKLRCQVHFPNHQFKDSATVQSYSSIGCSVTWDLEAIFPIIPNCAIMYQASTKKCDITGAKQGINQTNATLREPNKASTKQMRQYGS